MEMTCQHCGAKNKLGSIFCHDCGEGLGGTIMDMYPEYKFVPASLRKIKGRTKHWLWLLPPVLFGLFILWGTSSFVFLPEFLGYNEIDSVIICSFISVILLFIILYMTYQILKSTPWASVADYVQDSECAQYVFFVKDKKFGVYDQKKRKIQIPAEYDFLCWKQENQVLKAMKDGEGLYLDINNNVLT